MKKTIVFVFTIISLVSFSEIRKGSQAAFQISKITYDGKISAKSYIQDGIAAMIDGIENGGFGIHHEGSSAQYPIVDCITKMQYSKSETYLTDNGIGSQTMYGFPEINTEIGGLSEFTVEYVAKFDSDGYRQGWYSFIRGSTNSKLWYPLLRMATTNAIDGITILAGTYNPTVTIESRCDRLMCYAFFIMKPYMSKFGGAVNGEALQSKSLTSSTHIFPMSATSIDFTDYSNVQPETGLRKSRIYAIRTYSRALSDDEIEYNYSIDKERFGL